MADFILIIPVLASFLVSMIFMPSWIKKVRAIGLVWPDMNKISKEDVAGSGGIITVLGFIIGALIFVAYRVFVLNSSLYLVEIFAMLTSVLFLAGIGFIDDIFGWQKGGLRRRDRIILVIFAAIPLVVINAGRSIVSLPFFGSVDLGLIYPLILIPLGILGASTTFNFLAGFNGLEAGQGAIFLLGLSFVAYMTGSPWLAVIILCMTAALLGFLIFNIYPAKVFPGDSITYAVGGIIAISSILGNFERIALFFFIPYIIEFFLKLRGGLTKHSFGKINKDGTMDLKYGKIYGLTHASILILNKIGIRPNEKRVVMLIWLFQIIIILAGIFIFKEAIIP